MHYNQKISFMLWFRCLNCTTKTCLINLELSNFLSKVHSNTSLFFSCVCVFFFFFNFIEQCSLISLKLRSTGLFIEDIRKNLRIYDYYLLSIQFWSTPSSELQWMSKVGLWTPLSQKTMFWIFPKKTWRRDQQKVLGKLRVQTNPLNLAYLGYFWENSIWLVNY